MPTLFRFELDIDLFDGDPEAIATIMANFLHALRNCPSPDIRQGVNNQPFAAAARSEELPEPFGGMYLIEGEVSPCVVPGKVLQTLDTGVMVDRDSTAAKVFGPKKDN